MPSKRAAVKAMAAGVVLLCAGCGGGWVWVEREVMPPFEHAFIKKIAVVEFENLSTNRAAGKIVADHIEELLVNESGYEVVSRMELGQILKEHNLSVEMLLHPETMKKLGLIAGVDALVLGSVEAYERYGVTSVIEARFKLVDTTTGQVLWSKASRSDPRQEQKFVKRYTMKKGWEIGAAKKEAAMLRMLADARSLFPHKEKVKVRAGDVEDTSE